MNALQPRRSDGDSLDAFVVKIAPEGGAIIYGSYLGGLQHDFGSDIAVDTAGAAHVTGNTESADFPMKNALQPASGGPTDYFVDVFVTKFSPNGATLVYSTYLGGKDDDVSTDISVDLTGATYITGQTLSRDFPTTTSLQPEFGGGVCGGGESDAFVVKITEDPLASPPAAVNLAGPATTQSISSPRGGGGAIDAIFVLLLAQLAFATALRRRSASPHLSTPAR
jgi:hypothetical protein